MAKHYDKQFKLDAVHADIGKAFNMLVQHMNLLMEQQKKMYEQKQRLEMNALQAQINPHFLYKKHNKNLIIR